tara:strand:+ start:1234 stop:2832 length:1599 start_codon:yes stop_codon:yes gene_type:complete
MSDYNWFSPYITSLLMWEDTDNKTIVDEINENYLGGHKVRIKKIQEMIVKKDILEKNKNILNKNLSTIELLKLTNKKKLLFLLTIIFPSALNCYSIIIRWIDRPQRDTDALHNWSTLALIYVELAWLVCLLSCLVVNIFTVYTNKQVAEKLIVKKRFNLLSPKLFILFNIIGLCSSILLIWLTYNIGDIFITEYKYFYDNKVISSNQPLYNQTDNQTLIFNNKIESTFGDFDLELYIKLIIFYTLVGISYALLRIHKFYRRYHMENCDNHKHKEEHINFYDPIITENIVYFLNTINGISMLKIIAWIRHDSLDFIMSHKHKIDTENKENNIDSMIGTGCLNKFIYYATCLFSFLLTISIQFIIYGPFISLIVYLGLFNLIYRIKIIEYVGYIEPLSWSRNQWIGFLAFLNNILSLDTGKKKTFKSIFHFLFSGSDAKEDNREKLSQELFKRLLISYSICEQGLIKTIIVFSQLSHTDIQRICIYENTDEETNKIKKHNTELLDLKKYKGDSDSDSELESEDDTYFGNLFNMP